jgi:hypothetical protein
MNEKISDTPEPTAEPALVDQLVDKLFAIDLDALDIEQEMVALNQSNDFRFVVIPVTVLLLGAGMAIGLYMGAMMIGFLAGAFLAFLAGYAYQLWDRQWRDVAVKNVLVRIDEIEGKKGFLRWFRPLLGRDTYKTMFYKLYKQQVVDIEMYVRALHRLRDKPKMIVRAALIATHPELAPASEDNDDNTDSASTEQDTANATATNSAKA